MKSLIVTAHPESKSYGGAMARVIERSLRELDHQVEVLDLYAENFDPVVRQTQFRNRKDPEYFETMSEQGHQAAQDAAPDDIRRHHERLLWADNLILQFPLWWWSMPALMKGWVDRVFSMGFAYGGANLSPRRAMICVTAETKAEKFSAPPDAHPLEHIERGILKFSGYRVLPTFVVSDVWSISPEERQQKLDQLALHIKSKLSGTESAAA